LRVKVVKPIKNFKGTLAVLVAASLATCTWTNTSLADSLQWRMAYQKLSREIGRQFRTKAELAVCRIDGAKELSIAPLKTPGAAHQKRTILALLPAGSEFKVAKLEGSSAKNEDVIYYYGEITKTRDPQWKGQILLLDIMEEDIKIPRLDAQYAEEIK